MLMRTFPKTGIEVSAVSLGAEHLAGTDRKTTVDVVHAAMDHGMNYMDVFMPDAPVRDWIGDALQGRREKMLVGGHLCSVMENGQQSRTRDVAQSKAHFEDLLRRLRTDYVDALLFFFVDTMEDADACLDPKGLLGLAERLKREGKARMLGFSCHAPQVASRLVATGVFDMMMFSLNPAFDLMPKDTTIDDLFGEKLGQVTGRPGTIVPERLSLYRQCEAEGVGIVVMKGYGAGALLKRPGMTPERCIHYALTRPGVVTMAAGCRSVAEVEAAARYVTATDEERDYTEFMRQTQWNADGLCMYCNHCLPCPQEIDVAQVTRLLHRHEDGDRNAAAEYAKLTANGGSCIACGECAARCPFAVDSIGNMARAHELLARG